MAAAATDGTPKRVKFRGSTLTLPAHLMELIFELPIDWEDQLKKLRFAPLAKAICVAGGIEFDASMLMREAVELVTDTLRAYGLETGESLASLTPSETGGSHSRPTSKKSTVLTSQRAGTAKKRPAGGSGS